MQSFRHLLLRIVVLSAICNINVGGDFLICELVSGLNIIRCLTPGVNADNSPVNCLTDCICYHGASGASCDSGLCICNNDANLNATAMTQLRQKQCASVIREGSQKVSMTVLCPDGEFDGTCNPDCICGHGANSGRCDNVGDTLGDENFKLCISIVEAHRETLTPGKFEEGQKPTSNVFIADFTDLKDTTNFAKSLWG